MKDVKCIAIGQSIIVGPSERAEYEAAFEREGFKLGRPTPVPDWGADAIRLTRIA